MIPSSSFPHQFKQQLKDKLCQLPFIPWDSCDLRVFLVHHVTAKRHQLHQSGGHTIAPFQLWDQLCFLKQHFDFLPLIDAFHEAQNGKKLKNCCALIIDDGYRSIAEEFYPIAQDLEIPTTVFLVSSLIDHQQDFWRDQTRYLSLENQEEDFLKYCQTHYPELDTNFYDVSSFKNWTRRPQGNNSHLIQNALNAFFQEHEIDLSRYGSATAQEYYVTSEDLKQAPSMIHFGNHTATHPVMPTLSDEEQQNEIEQCHKALAEYPNTVPLFSMPFGRYTSKTLSLVKDYGYDGIVLHSNEPTTSIQLQQGVAKSISISTAFQDLQWFLLKKNFPNLMKSTPELPDFMKGQTELQQDIFLSLSPKVQKYLSNHQLAPEVLTHVLPKQLLSENNHTRQFIEDYHGEAVFTMDRLHIHPTLQDYLENGLEAVKASFPESMYCAFYEFLHNQGQIEDPQHPGAYYQVSKEISGLWERFLKVVKLYENLKEKGYLSKGVESEYILVKPCEDGEHYEVLSGHHRASILWLLKYPQIRVLVLRSLSDAL